MVPFELIQSELYGGGVAVKKLWSELGPLHTLRVLADVAVSQAQGEPWRGLGKPADRKEALSRRQLGAAVLLERALRKITTPDTARELVSHIVLTASIDFLERNVPVLRKDKILSMNDTSRDRYLQRIQNKFFNADADMRLDGEDKLYMTIRRCRFVELLDAIGERDMAPLFCEGDRVFFDEHQPDITLERPQTLSCGGAICDFQFSWID
jgi:hypothetical protein